VYAAHAINRRHRGREPVSTEHVLSWLACALAGQRSQADAPLTCSSARRPPPSTYYRQTGFSDHKHSCGTQLPLAIVMQTTKRWSASERETYRASGNNERDERRAGEMRDDETRRGSSLAKPLLHVRCAPSDRHCACGESARNSTLGTAGSEKTQPARDALDPCGALASSPTHRRRVKTAKTPKVE